MKTIQLLSNNILNSFLICLFVFTGYQVNAQLSIDASSTPYTIDFDGTVADVNNDVFTGSGFSPTPAAGQLNSNAWASSGMSDGALGFGGTGTTVNTDFTRGASTGSETSGGYYAFDIGGGNVAFGIQPGGSDWTPGSMTLKIQNNTGLFITSLDVVYNIYVLNDQGRSNSFNFAHSEDDVSYTNEVSLNFTSVEAASGLPVWQVTNRTITLSGLEIAPGTNYYLRWLGDDVGGGGSRDEFALDDISITATTTDPVITTSTSGPLSFANTEVGSHSTEQSYTVSGTNLIADLVVTAPTNFEVSVTSGSGFSNSVAVTPVSGTVPNTTVYVRMSPAAIGNHSDLITHTSASATQKDVSVNGLATTQPVCSYSDDFTDNDFSSSPGWTGSTGSFAVIPTSPVPSGNVSTDGAYLSSNASVGAVAMTTASNITDEWRFSLASPAFDPSDNNYIGVILMSNVALSGDITGVSWDGYYLRIGDDSPGTDKITLYRRTGMTSTSIGAFTSSPSFSSTALEDGLNLRVTRDGTTGEFEVFYSSGFTYGVVPVTSAGTQTDATHSTSSYFGVFQKINNTDPSRRIYFDNFCTFDRTYTWVATTGTADWQTADSWSPPRITPSATDILLFDQGGSSTATNVPTETIRQFLVSNSTSISLKAAAGTTQTLSVSGTTGTDFEVGAGSTLIFDSNGDALEISLLSSSTGSVDGTIQFTKTSGFDPNHRLLADAASAIVFNNGSVFHAKDCAGNAFGMTLPAASHIFASGATYISEDGGHPFGLSQPNSKVVFQTGSLFSHRQGTVPSFSGRTYADFELDFNGTVNFNTTFIGAPTVCSIDNFTVTQGTFDFVFKAYPQDFNLNGELSVANGAAFNFSPADVTATATFNFNGAFNGMGGSGSITFGENSIVEINSNVDVSANPLIKGVLNRNAGLISAIGGGAFSFGNVSTLNYNGVISLNASLEWPNTGSSTGPANINIDISGQSITLTTAKEVRGILSVKSNSTLNSNGNLTLQSGAILLHGEDTPGGGGAVNGDITLIRTATNTISSQAFHYWSSPVDQPNAVILGSKRYYFDPLAATGATNNDGLRDGWQTASTTMTNGQGYVSTGGSINFTGTANSNPIVSPMTLLVYKQSAPDVKWNLIGNPYPSPLDIELFLNANSGTLEGAISLWDNKTGSSNYEESDYLTWNSMGAAKNGPNHSSITFAGYVATGQSFFVEMLDGASSGDLIQFTNDMRSDSSGTNDAFFRRKPLSRLWMSMTNSNGNYNETLIGFVDDATDGKDRRYDAKKLRGNDKIALFSKLNGEDYAIQGLPPLTADRVIALGVGAGVLGNHTLKLDRFENMDETVVIYLEDKELGIMHNLRVNPEYTFNVQTTGDIDGRFYLHFNAPLDITTTATACDGSLGEILLDQPGTMKWNYTLSDHQHTIIANQPNFSGTALIDDLAGGTYTLLLNDGNGYQLTKTIEIAAKQPVVSAFEVSDNAVDVNEAVVFTNSSTGATQYEWNFGDGMVISGIPEPIHEYNLAGYYAVTLKAINNDCEHITTKYVNVSDATTGIGTSSGKDLVNIYGADNAIYIHFNFRVEQKATIRVYNMLGEELHQETVNTVGTPVISVGRSSGNYYLVSVITEGVTYNAKVFLTGL